MLKPNQKHKQHKPVIKEPKPNKYIKHFALLGILILTAIVFSNSFNNGFVGWDDEPYVTKNKNIELTKENINNSFLYGEHHFDDPNRAMYVPLTALSISINHYFSGLNPRAYHLTNLIIHLINVILVFLLIYLLVNRLDITIITTVLFAIHPVQVESVTFVAGRRDVLYSLFYLASLVAYTQYIRIDKKNFYVFSIFFFLLSLFSKGQAVVLPLTLIAIDFLFKRRLLDKKVIFEKIPFFALSLIMGLVVMLKGFGKTGFDYFAPLYERILYACYGFVQYILKVFMPYKLSIIHSYPDKINGHLPTVFWLYPIIVIAIIILLIYMLKHSRVIVFCMLFFIVNIILVLQIVPNSSNIINEHYLYLAAISGFMLIGVGYKYLLDKKPQIKKSLPVIMIIVFLFLSTYTYNRNEVFKDGITIYTDVLSKYPESKPALNNLGGVKESLGDYQGAISEYNKLIQLDPKYPQAYYNRGIAKSKSGDNSGAINDFNNAMMLNPIDADIYFNRGVAKTGLQDITGAVADYNRAIQLKPNFIDPYVNRGNIKKDLGDYIGAIADFNKAIQINPKDADTYLGRGVTKVKQSDYQGAIADFNKAIEVKPKFALAYANRGLVKIGIGEKETGCSDLHKSKELGLENADYLLQKHCNTTN